MIKICTTSQSRWQCYSGVAGSAGFFHSITRRRKHTPALFVTIRVVTVGAVAIRAIAVSVTIVRIDVECC